ncbi:MAG: LpxL/LpxP family Kdo(2)-lipid IV(A) lauroyl/palmitoleoyl acyltransferase [Psychrobium sp.]|nr:LpxL/LpxP family Kdo(2)-lipid IV(A) lauroyl/palmitoleoyl acyltransferase [Psychrobium sp.]
MLQKPSFKLSYLHPRFWLLWLAMGLLWLTITILPYKLLLKLGGAIGTLLMKLLKKRAHTAKRNLELCYPDMAQSERDNILAEHNRSVGITIFETGMAWWWPQWRMEKLITFSGLEHIAQANKDGNGVLLFAIHSFCLEISGRLFTTKIPTTSVYRPHNNPVMEYLQVVGRLRSVKLITKRNIRAMISALNDGEAVWYTSDQDFGRSKAVFVPYFAVPEAATVVGASILTKNSKSVVLPYVVKRKDDGSGYHISIEAPLANFPSGDDTADATFSNKIVERSIMQAPGQYMWLHRRFKTRPNKDDASLYG